MFPCYNLLKKRKSYIGRRETARTFTGKRAEGLPELGTFSVVPWGRTIREVALLWWRNGTSLVEKRHFSCGETVLLLWRNGTFVDKK